MKSCSSGLSPACVYVPERGCRYQETKMARPEDAKDESAKT